MVHRDCRTVCHARGDIEKVKAFVTRRVDRFRPPYGHRVIEAPRQSIFIGSTNNDTYLKDETGGRRFWPVACGDIDIDKLRADKDQFWAEAVVGFKAGMSWGLTDSKAIKEAEREQKAQRVAGVWEGPVAKFIEDKESVIIEDILSNVLHIDLAKQGQIEQNRVSRCLKALDWQRGWLHDKRCYRRRRVGKLLHAGGKGARHQ